MMDEFPTPEVARAMMAPPLNCATRRLPLLRMLTNLFILMRGVGWREFDGLPI